MSAGTGDSCLDSMKILVRGTNWVGDAVMSIPAMRSLRRIFPDAFIALHTRDFAADLFRDVEFIDELITFEPSRWKVRDTLDNSRFLERDRFDLAILFTNSFETALTAFLARVPRRFGYNKDLRGLLLTDPIAVPEWKNRRHEVFYYLNLIAAVEKSFLGRETVLAAVPDVRLDYNDETSAVPRLLDRLDRSRKTVALGVGSTNSRAKRWPAANYASLADRLAGELSVNVLLVGSPADQKVAGEVIDKSSIKPLDLVGRTSLSEAADVLHFVDLLISNDMGLAHLAPAAGTATTVIFGPTNPLTTSPIGDNVEVISKQVSCAPCMLRDCPIDHRCMNWISVDEVFESATRQLEV